MYAAVHPWAVINGGINQRVFGDAALDMAPLDTIQKSGVLWGFGSDGSRANQILPFTTLGWAVTGKMVGGTKVLRQPISREDALIAHTRRNAFLVFQENNLGSIQAGRLADLVVLDRDYLTIPADQIKDIQPVMTMVGGRIVFEAAPQTKRVSTSNAQPPTPRLSPDALGVGSWSLALDGVLMPAYWVARAKITDPVQYRVHGPRPGDRRAASGQDSRPRRPIQDQRGAARLPPFRRHRVPDSRAGGGLLRVPRIPGCRRFRRAGGGVVENVVVDGGDATNKSRRPRGLIATKITKNTMDVHGSSALAWRACSTCCGIWSLIRDTRTPHY